MDFKEVGAMKDYWLAKLISSVDHVDSRKRLQKAVFLLQKNGCPLSCEYILHYYGPYSYELANLVDKLKNSGIIEETQEQRGSSVLSYNSRVLDRGRSMLASFEQSNKGKELLKEISPFIDQFRELMSKEVWILELAATVAYFYVETWKDAVKQTAAFKKVKINDSKLEQALKLAKKFKKCA